MSNNEELNEKKETIEKDIESEVVQNPAPEDEPQTTANKPIDPMSFDDPDVLRMKGDVWKLIFLQCPQFADMLIQIYRNSGGADGVNRVYNDIIRYATICGIVNHEIPVGLEIDDTAAEE